MMAHTDKLSPEYLTTVAEQIADLLDDELVAEFPEDSTVSLTIGESFAVYTLKPGTVTRALQDQSDLVAWAEPTKTWHHQIKFNHESKAYARSAQTGRKPRLIQLNISPLAEVIDQTINWLDQFDQEEQKDFLVRLLEIPRYGVYAFWLLDEPNQNSQVVVLKSQAPLPSVKSRAVAANSPRQPVLGSAEFLAAIKRETPAKIT